MIDDDVLDAFAVPRCPKHLIVMRPLPGGWICPDCGRIEVAPPVTMPPDFDGPEIHPSRQ